MIHVWFFWIVIVAIWDNYVSSLHVSRHFVISWHHEWLCVLKSTSYYSKLRKLESSRWLKWCNPILYIYVSFPNFLITYFNFGRIGRVCKWIFNIPFSHWHIGALCKIWQSILLRIRSRCTVVKSKR